MSDKLKSANKYLRPERYYLDLYDEFTVGKCRDIERRFREKSKLPNKQGLTKEGVRAAADIAIHISTYYCSGERALKEVDKIAKGMNHFKRPLLLMR